MGRKSNIEKSESEAEIYEPMDFDEITRRLRNGADIQTLADLHGWGYTKMVQRLQYMEKKHGRQLLTPDIMRPSHRKMYLAQKAAAEKRAQMPEPDIKDIKPRWPKESKTDPEEPEPARIPEEVYTARVIIPPPEGQKIITASVLETILAHAEESRRLANEYAADAEAWQTLYNLATKGTAFPEGNI